MRALLLPLTLLCTTLATTSLTAQSRRILMPGVRGVPPSELIDTMGTPREVPYTASKVFAAMEKVYESLKVKPEIHAAPAQIGNQALYSRGKFAGHRMSAILDCGGGMTGLYADSYRIYLGLVTFIEENPGRTSTVRTVLVGNALNVTEGVRPTQKCRSVGELEAKMHDMMLKELAKTP